jgi:hypothetical protein
MSSASVVANSGMMSSIAIRHHLVPLPSDDSLYELADSRTPGRREVDPVGVLHRLPGLRQLAVDLDPSAGLVRYESEPAGMGATSPLNDESAARPHRSADCLNPPSDATEAPRADPAKPATCPQYPQVIRTSVCRDEPGERRQGAPRLRGQYGPGGVPPWGTTSAAEGTRWERTATGHPSARDQGIGRCTRKPAWPTRFCRTSGMRQIAPAA